jgi:uncharacterized membrane protein
MSEQRLSADKVERLLNRLHSPEEAKRVHAALRLAGPGVDAEQIRPALEAARADADPHVRRLADWILERLGASRPAA